MTLYNDPAVLYNDPAVLYNGIRLREHVTLIVAGVDMTDELADEPISVHTATHGNSLGTLDAALDDPALVPAAEDPIDYYAGFERLYRGHVRTIEEQERADGSILVRIGCQDAGPDEGALPDPAPFGVSDDADGVSTREYVSLARQVRTTEGGSPKTTYVLVVEFDGLRPGMNVEVTSARLGLVAEELTIIEMQAQRLYHDAPHYVFTLGEVRVRLSQVVSELEVPDDSITATKISDGAIITPKLAANAVTAAKVAAGAIEADKLAANAVTAAKVAAGAIEADKIAAGAILSDKFVAGSTGRIPAGVELGREQTNISAAGVRVRASSVDRVVLGDIGGGDFGLKVVNPGSTVIIDGTSNMFKIQASGTQSVNTASKTNTATDTTLTALGTFASTPGHLSFVGHTNLALSAKWIGSGDFTLGLKFLAQSSGGSPTWSMYVSDLRAQCATFLNGSSECVVRLLIYNSTANTQDAYSRFYILKEAAL